MKNTPYPLFKYSYHKGNKTRHNTVTILKLSPCHFHITVAHASESTDMVQITVYPEINGEGRKWISAASTGRPSPRSYTSLTAARATGGFEFRQLPLSDSRCWGRLCGEGEAVGRANITEHQRMTKLCHQISILNFLFLKRMCLLWTHSQMVTSGRTDVRDQSPGPKFPLLDKCQHVDSYMIHAFLAPSPSVCMVFTV